MKVDTVVVKKRPHEAARRRSEPMAVEFDEVNDIALQRAWLSVLRRQRNPLGPR